VAKDCAPWERFSSPTIGPTKVLRDREDVRALEQAVSRPGGVRVLVQEYLPDDDRPSRTAPDWFVHMYCDDLACPRLVFTGVKLRSWPVGGGWTTRAVATAQPELAEATAELCRRIGYRGIGDLDWRYDRRNDRFALVDFNPRLGAQAQVFRTTTGMDLVRALHLDMSGRSSAAGRQIDARELIVEHFNAASVLASGYRWHHVPPHPHGTRRELAWFAWDDPAPFVMATARFAMQSARWIGSRAA
jgi:D-aspartate ligase